MKKKHVAGVLAFFVGMFGVHRFYLGQRFLGAVYLFVFFITMLITIEEGVPAILVPSVLAFIDAILLWVMPQEDFDDRYNKKRMRKEGGINTRGARREKPDFNRKSKNKLQELKKKGIELFRDYEFENAIDYFEDALELDPKDAALHFNLACCYSMVEDAETSFEHLEAAFDNGFDASKKIQNHSSLAYLRTHPDFDHFVANDYKVMKSLPTPQENLLHNIPSSTQDEPSSYINKDDDLLTQISKLGELLDKGILSQEEFAVQKQKLLADD